MKRIDVEEVLNFFKNNPDWKPTTWRSVHYGEKTACVMGAILISRGLDKDIPRYKHDQEELHPVKAQVAACELFSHGYTSGVQAGFTRNPAASPAESLGKVFKALVDGLPKGKTWEMLTPESRDIINKIDLGEFAIGWEEGKKIWNTMMEAGLIPDSVK